MSVHSQSTASPSSSVNSFGVKGPGLVLVYAPFSAGPQAKRLHSQFIDGTNQRPLFFAQHRKTTHEAALFAGREKIGQVTEDELELSLPGRATVTVRSEKLYRKKLFARSRSWKAPDGLKYTWDKTQDGVRLVETKSNCVMVHVADSHKGSRIVISSQIVPFVELMLLTYLQQEFEWSKQFKKAQEAADDDDMELGVW